MPRRGGLKPTRRYPTTISIPIQKFPSPAFEGNANPGHSEREWSGFVFIQASVRLLCPKEFAQVRILSYTVKLSLHNILDVLLHLIVVELDGSLHLRFILSVILEIGNKRYRLVCRSLLRHFPVIHNNLCIEDLLLYTLIEIVTDCTDKHTLCESGNLARRDKRIHLGIEGMADVASVDAHRLTFL